MKKIIFIVLISLALVTIGCENEQKQKYNEPQIYFEKLGPNDIQLGKSELIYQNSKYKYFVGEYKKTYVEHKGKQYSFSEALDKHIITLDDLKEAGVYIYERLCLDHKLSNELRIYFEEVTPGHSQLSMIYIIYDDSEYRYIVPPYEKAYVEYKGKQYGYYEALDENIITLDDLKDAGVHILKTKIGSNVYEEYEGK